MPKANAPIESYTTLAIPNNSTPAVQSARLKRVPRSLPVSYTHLTLPTKLEV